MPRILAIGECMVELAATGPDSYRMGFAGDTFNTAWYLRRLLPGNWTVGYCSRVGTDATSARMLAFMQSAGIDTSAVDPDPDRTVGLYMIETSDGERSFSYWRGQSAARRLADDPARLDAVFAGAEVLFFSGITLAILAPPARAGLCAALSRARAQGATVVFDTNMRPRLWADADDLRAGILAGAAVADIVLPSLDEEQAQFGAGKPESVARRYLEAGASTVVVKNGAGPALLAQSDGTRILGTPPKVARVVDTTAAGDSFDAGFLAAHFTGAPLSVALTRAMDLAAHVVQAPGALVDPGRSAPDTPKRPKRKDPT